MPGCAIGVYHVVSCLRVALSRLTGTYTQLGAHGAKVMVMGRRQNFLEEAVEQLKANGAEAGSDATHASTRVNMLRTARYSSRCTCEMQCRVLLRRRA